MQAVGGLLYLRGQGTRPRPSRSDRTPAGQGRTLQVLASRRVSGTFGSQVRSERPKGIQTRVTRLSPPDARRWGKAVREMSRA